MADSEIYLIAAPLTSAQANRQRIWSVATRLSYCEILSVIIPYPTPRMKNVREEILNGNSASALQGYVCDFGTTPDPSIEAPEVSKAKGSQ